MNVTPAKATAAIVRTVAVATAKPRPLTAEERERLMATDAMRAKLGRLATPRPVKRERSTVRTTTNGWQA